ncbi:polysaccharide lyase family protein [Mucilaginibacter paludis]|uniref:rhamnogalacturonan endolyase n=1 Tax=Mucilaginibacter paludis DSM 18603 TaxID=714943 RepID=H1Y9S0_9SPHI|nr:polysaccharide lyase family protein [Mucilaginibacter paludis]EHQ31103.1 hypothetical protein Mucpa_7060 [Mucilaginibacter paludis DSM 18603]
MSIRNPLNFILLFTVYSTIAFAAGYKQADTAMFTDQGDRVLLNNGIVSAVINKSSAHMMSYRYRGIEVLKDGYYSMDGGKSYAQPGHCEVSVKVNTPNLVDVMFKSRWQPGLRQQAFDIECHYVIEKGTAGIYCYALLTHEARYPQGRIGEWRYVWKLPDGVFDHINVDLLRNMDMPSADDYRNAERTTIPEAIKLKNGIKAGQYECKYNYSAAYYDIGTWGHTSNKNKIGAWMVLGGYDFLNDGPTQADLNAAAGINHLHFARNHYAGSVTSVATGEKWSKIFGPFLLFVNSSNDVPNALWADAQKRVAEEKAKWPYTWLTGVEEYPNSAHRGVLAGTFKINDPYKPDVKGANAWIGLTTPEVDWENDSKNYQYWVKTDNEGKFTIANVRPGQYTLHAYASGAVGEFEKQGINISSGETKQINTLTWVIPRDKGKLMWEIGIPNRTAIEFKFGNQYWHPFMWETYSPALPNPLIYNVGSSDWRKDWNYVQSAYWNNDGTLSQWPWKINFNLDKLPSVGGEATLTFAFASLDRARLVTFINDDITPFDTFLPTLKTGGNALIRQGIHAKYSTYVLKIPVSKLHRGNNSITLVSNSGKNRTDHIMYDYISMEIPQ